MWEENNNKTKEEDMGINEILKDALILKYQGEIAAAKANIKVYLINPVGIGEHPDLISAIDVEMEKAAEADDKLTFLENQLDW